MEDLVKLLSDPITKILEESEHPLPARTIGAKLRKEGFDVTKSDVNSVLYSTRTPFKSQKSPDPNVVAPLWSLS